MVLLVLEKEAYVNGTGFQGNTALQEAAVFGHEEIVWLLLENGTDAKEDTLNEVRPCRKQKRAVAKLWVPVNPIQGYPVTGKGNEK